MKALMLSLTLVALFQADLYPQQFLGKMDFIPSGDFAMDLESVLATEELSPLVTPIDTVRVDGVQHMAQLQGGGGCGQQDVRFSDIPEGLYAVAISGGPGISKDYGGYGSVGCYLSYSIPGVGWENYGLHGLGAVDDPRSFVIYEVAPGDIGGISLFLADSWCEDNSGYVDVTLYQIRN